MLMAKQTWRLDPIGNGALAWLYLITHAVDLKEATDATTRAGYTITEEAQSLVDDQFGGCLRYLAVKLN